MNEIILWILSLIAGSLFGKYVIAKSVIWIIERKFGKYYRIKFKDYEGNPAIIHILTKDNLAEEYALIIQETHLLIRCNLLGE